MTTSKLRQAAQLLSKLGARKGGLARAQGLTPTQRAFIARRAALARWKRHREAPKESP